LKIPVEKVVDKGIKAKDNRGMIEDRVTTMKKELSKDVNAEEVKGALKRSFAMALDVVLEEGSLSAEEKEIRDSAISKYESPEWVFRR
jgi:lipoate-protein ligase A